MRRQRPDLRRDCDAKGELVKLFWIPAFDAKDLIYEGIATAIPLYFIVLSFLPWDAKDLIYEGIAT